ncbi:MAG: SGNH/GDSL hydrolase family protein [Gemmataceae bacterium]|nr:SGNH/GDSL hydrolase family protein [Gemmataceae bacterium]MCI0740642.1 SGNH/GDSL hydrolase family protein [Gemmataceae bacterium]
MKLWLIVVVCLFSLSEKAISQEKFLLQDSQRVLFLGDSNTFAGLYIAYIDAYLYTRFPDKRIELINLGLPSETVSGLSEPDHPYPRPNVFERLDRALEKTKPHVVFACYGMNDGIYHPFADERFAEFKKGVQTLTERVKKSGAKLYWITPAPFDPMPIRKNVLPLGEPKYSWMKPYENYDGVLDKYSAWLLTLRAKGIPVVNAHAALNGFLTRVRSKEPKYFLSGDGIHPNPTGHALVASQILQAIYAPDEVDMAEIDLRMKRAINGNVKDVKLDGDELSFTWLCKTPWPFDPRWHARLAELEQLRTQLNRFDLIVSRAGKKRYALWEGEKKLGEAARDDLLLGLDLGRYPALSANQRAMSLWKLVEQRQKLLALAWLTDVGHKRPDTPKGIALDAAKKQAEKLDEQIRDLAKPRAIDLKLTPLDE